MARTIKVPAWKFQIPRLPKYDPDEPDVFEEMTLQEHLTELASRIKKMVIGIVIGFIIGAVLVTRILSQIVDAANLETRVVPGGYVRLEGGGQAFGAAFSTMWPLLAVPSSG